MDIKNKILAYLHFGYFPAININFESKSWARFNSKKIKNQDYNESLLFEKGAKAIENAISNNVEDGVLNVVPLSGGLDSRTILAGLLDLGLKEKIVTVTFGTPLSFDYELGKYVAQKVGVKHESIDLTKVKLEQSILESTSKRLNNWTYLINSFYNSLIRDKFGKDVVYWSGFMGESLAGHHLVDYNSDSWERAIDKFIWKNRYSKSVELTPKSFDPRTTLPRKPLFSKEKISYGDQLDFAIRQESAIKTNMLDDNYKYKTPFLEQEWVDFILFIPPEYRKHRYFYKKFVNKVYPKLFAFPTTSNYGLPLDAPKWKKRAKKTLWHWWRSPLHRVLPSSPWLRKPEINYIDFKEGLHKREDLKNIVYNNIQNLKQRGIIDWVDFQQIWDEHQSKKNNHSKALILLASLEIYLKSCKLGEID